MQLDTKTIHIIDARRRLLDHEPHDISVWEQDTGHIIEYKAATYIGGHTRQGSYRVRLANSGEIRQFCEIMLRKIDNLRVLM